MMGTETLDATDAPQSVVRATLKDIARSNALFGGQRAVVEALGPLFRTATPGTAWTLLDLGTGGGDVAAAVRGRAAQVGLDLRLYGVEHHRVAARVAQEMGVIPVVADVGKLPVRPQSVDIVVMSQLLHHLPRGDLTMMIQTAARIARRAVVIADIRRTWIAAAGIWIVSFPLRFHPVSRRDGVTSVRQGFTRGEFATLLKQAGVNTFVRKRPGFRLVAVWESPGLCTP